MCVFFPPVLHLLGVIATKDQDIGTTNLHIEVSDMVNILVYVGAVRGNASATKLGRLFLLDILHNQCSGY